MIDLFIFVLYTMIAASIFMMSKRMRSGFAVHALANIGWICVGFKIGLTSMVIWSILFTAISTYGFFRKEKA